MIYIGYPIKWWQSYKRRHCPHAVVRGIYGDEINRTPGYRRNQCEDCGQLLDGPVSIGEGRRPPKPLPPFAVVV